jgi:predicted RNase H-like HicB family nuclease
MLLDYLNAALERATYDKIEDEEPFYGEIPGIQGVWATGKTLEECRRSLLRALEDWVFFSIYRGETIPDIGGVSRIPLSGRCAPTSKP